VLARFANARVNEGERRKLRAALYRPLLGLDKKARWRIVAATSIEPFDRAARVRRHAFSSDLPSSRSRAPLRLSVERPDHSCSADDAKTGPCSTTGITLSPRT
jgi:hypothetical protein